MPYGVSTRLRFETVLCNLVRCAPYDEDQLLPAALADPISSVAHDIQLLSSNTYAASAALPGVAEVLHRVPILAHGKRTGSKPSKSEPIIFSTRIQSRNATWLTA